MDSPKRKRPSVRRTSFFVLIWLAATVVGYVSSAALVLLPGLTLVDCQNCSRAPLVPFEFAAGILLVAILGAGVLPFIRSRRYAMAAILFTVSLMPPVVFWLMG